MSKEFNKEEIISGNDMLSEELEKVAGGAAADAEKDLCVKGCISGGVSTTPESAENPE